MNIGVLGTGMVGQGIADKLVSLGHTVRMGARQAGNAKAAEFVARHKAGASQGTFAEAAAFGDMLIVASKGTTALEVLQAAGAANLNGKVVLDISNPLDTSGGGLPTLSVLNTDSLAEQIQRAFPGVRLVKSLNTVNVGVMVNPAQLAQDTDIFVSGNDAAAKAQVIELLKSFGWKAPIDLGDITTARGTEMLMPLWMRLWGALGTPAFNFKIVR
jgi:8-hydroxy-5-deazaflavin:NADPH oxidoreductase